MKKRFLWRLQSRGLVGSARLAWHYTRYFTRSSTPRKLRNVVLTKVAKRLRRDHLPTMPYRYTIDPTNVCNLRCPLCPTGLGILGRDRGLMKLDDFRAVVDQISPWCYLLDMYNWGEPFLHPDIFEMIRYAADRRIFVRLSSNLNRFDANLAQRAVASGLAAITVSIDGATEESYQKYRRRGKLEVVLRNLEHLVQAKRDARANHPFIVVRMLVNRYNEGEVEQLRERVLALGVDLFVTGDLFVDTTNPEQAAEWLPTDPENSVYQYQPESVASTALENVWHCSDLWESMTINWDGGVSPCCWLHEHKHDFANALSQPIDLIWNGDAYLSARRVFAPGGPQEGPQKVICATCKGRPHYLKM